MVTFPWGTNHVINAYFTGSDFAVRSIGDDVSRTEKVAAIVDSQIDLSFLSFCRQNESIPENCGLCKKCIRTKAMFVVTSGSLPDIFVDKSFDAELMQTLHVKGHERTHIFDLYAYAKERGRSGHHSGLIGSGGSLPPHGFGCLSPNRCSPSMRAVHTAPPALSASWPKVSTGPLSRFILARMRSVKSPLVAILIDKGREVS